MSKHIKQIISEMALEEKIQLLTGEEMHTIAFPKYGIESVEMSDGPSGVRLVVDRPPLPGGDVAVPTASAQAASWNPQIVERLGNLIALNCKERQIDLLLAPGVNIQRNPLCGRNYEYYSEDPYLAGELGSAYVKGIQEYGVGTSLKHFAANHQEIFRGVVNAEISERPLREIYLSVFEDIVKKAKPTTVMCAYNKVNGQYCSENKKLLTDILRTEWGYEGAVVSDWGAVHNPALAVKAGMDIIMPEYKNLFEELSQALENGLITEEDIDRAIEHILNMIEQLHSLPQPEETFDRQKAHEYTVEAARESITLLKNEDHILPLNPDEHKKIGIVGYFAEEPAALGGNGAGGYVTVDLASVEKTLDVLKEYAENTEFLYTPIYTNVGGDITFRNMIEIQKISRQCDVMIMFAGNPRYWEIEGEDRDSLELPVHMIRMIEECCRFCENTIIVMQTGAPYAPFMRIASPKALVQMWFSGEGCGRAIADVLFGRANPSGKLPMTFMKKMPEAIKPCRDGRYIDYSDGLFVGYRYYDQHTDEIWYPFGYGLSYTTFAYSGLTIQTEDHLTAAVTFSITNTGNVAGKEICQLYVQPLESSVLRPIKELKGFDKISLEPGETKQVTIVLDERAFSYFNTNENAWHEESGQYGILIGASSQDIRLSGIFEVRNPNDYTINRNRWRSTGRKELIGGTDSFL